MGHHFSHPQDDSINREIADKLRKQIDEQTKTLGLGATRSFPQGIVNDLDEGEIQFAIKGDAERERVFVNFGKSVDVLGMTPRQAIEFAQLLIRHARAVTREPLVVSLH